MKGKKYANRKPKKDRPIGDFYGTPISLLWELFLAENHHDYYYDDILEPCCGHGNLSNELKKWFDNIKSFDLYYGNTKQDFLQYNQRHKTIITNFPFSEWDKMVYHAKKTSTLIYTIGKMNFWGAHGRNKNGLWKNLKKIYVFDRQVDYRTPYRKDGCFHVGNLVTGWFCWDMTHTGPTTIGAIDVQKYAKLGAYK